MAMKTKKGSVTITNGDSLILTKTLKPFLQKGTTVSVMIEDNRAYLFRAFCGGVQAIGDFSILELPSIVAPKPIAPKPQELKGDAYVADFRERMGWNFSSTQQQTASCP